MWSYVAVDTITWIMCQNCKVWAHQSCELEHGIEDDDGTYNCINYV